MLIQGSHALAASNLYEMVRSFDVYAASTTALTATEDYVDEPLSSPAKTLRSGTTSFVASLAASTQKIY